MHRLFAMITMRGTPRYGGSLSFRFRLFVGLLSGLLLGMLIGPPAVAQTYPQWGAMQPGPYEVGIRVIHTYDYSRGYWPKVDYQGQRDTLETARPMQISIWYPAQPQPEATRMVFGDYIALKASAVLPEWRLRRRSAARACHTDGGSARCRARSGSVPARDSCWLRPHGADSIAGVPCQPRLRRRYRSAAGYESCVVSSGRRDRRGTSSRR